MSNGTNDLKILAPELPLLTCYSIRGIRIPSRFFLAPINTGFFADGLPTEGLRQFHVARSGKSIGVSYVGNVAIAPEFVNSPTTGYLTLDKRWQAIAGKIAEQGSIPAIQLGCKTMQVPAPKIWVNRDVPTFVDRTSKHLLSLSTEFIDRVFAAFVSAAHMACNHGFRIVQLHAAHGYFLSLLLSRTINQRRDRYGDGVEALSRLVKSVRSLSLPLLIDVRISMTEGISNREEEIQQSYIRIAQLANADLDILSLSDGFYDVNKFRIYPRTKDGLGCYLDFGVTLASKHSNRLWNVAGNVWDVRPLLARLPPNLTLSIGRSLIADPAFIEKQVKGEGHNIQPCIRSGYCHYYSRGRPHIECHVNPSVAGDPTYHKPLSE